jgi:membrane protein implicated in regulation of membrane protease activity
MTRQRNIPTLRDLTWHLPAVLAGLAFVISIGLVVAFGVSQPLLLLAIFGGSLIVVLSAAVIVIGLVALNDPWVWDKVEGASNRLIAFVFRFPRVSTGEEGLVGRRGIVIEGFESLEGDLSKGRVRVAGESWAAIVISSATRLSIGEEVVVRSVHGLTLIVEASAIGDV